MDLVEWARALEREVADSWHQYNNEPERFADAASTALGATGVVPCDFARLIDASGKGLLPTAQTDVQANFGDAPITLATNDAFSISAIVWLTASTAIHDHGFSGAFCVVDGYSIHSTHRFESRDAADAPVRFGQLTDIELERLGPGEVREIHAGPALVHSLCHVPAPTISLVVRTHLDRTVPAQYSYSPLGLATSSFPTRVGLAKKQQLLKCSLRVSPQDVAQTIRDLTRDSPAHETLVLARTACLSLRLEDEAVTELLDRVSVATGAVIEHGGIVRRSIRADQDVIALTNLRAAIRDADCRVLLGLLATRRGASLLRAIAGLFEASEPVAKTMGIVERLCSRASASRPVEGLGAGADDETLAAVERHLQATWCGTPSKSPDVGSHVLLRMIATDEWL